MAAVKNLCSRAVWLHRGGVRSVGSAEKLVVEYLNETPATAGAQYSAYGLSLLSAEILHAETGRPSSHLIFGEDYDFCVRMGAQSPFKRAGVVLQVCNAFGELITSICTPEEGIAPFTMERETGVNIALRPLRLFPGKYKLDIFVFRPNDTTRYLDVEGALTFEVHPGVIAGGMWSYQSHHGCVRIADRVTVSP
jgi:lipopolysaccharide transport system ATP-binding protein